QIPGYAELEPDGEDAAHGRLPDSFLRTDSAALGMSWVGDRGFLGVGHSLFNSRYGVPGHVHPGHDDHDHGHGHDHDHDHDHGHDGHTHDHDHGVHIVMDQRRSELRAGLDDLDGFESLRLKIAHNVYTHTEYEDNA